MTTAEATAGVFRQPSGDETTGSNDRLALLGLRRPPAVDGDVLVTGAMVRLRALVPQRALGIHEVEGAAERQANRLRAELGVLGPILTEADLATLPWLTVTRREGFPTSGMATKTEDGWIIVLRSDEAMVRQRFSLAHEIKHVLDDGLLADNGDLYPATRGYSADERAERVCDRFAGALLMPKVLLRADWADGLQDIARLAKRYDVSRQAMTVRLSQLGLIESPRRCMPPAGHVPSQESRS